MNLHVDFPVRKDGTLLAQQYIIVVLGGNLPERYYGADTLPEAETIAERLRQERDITMIAIGRTFKVWI